MGGEKQVALLAIAIAMALGASAIQCPANPPHGAVADDVPLPDAGLPEAHPIIGPVATR